MPIQTDEAPCPRPLVLTFISAYLPGYRFGGPIRSLSNIADQLRADIDFRIVTADRDVGDIQAYPNVCADTWNDVGGTPVFYRSPGTAGWRALRASLPGDIGLIYLNSFFDPQSTIRPVLWRLFGWLPRAPLLIAPRGELLPAALAIKPLKKAIFLLLTRMCGFYRDAYWQVSSDVEAAAVADRIGAPRSRIFVTPNIGARPNAMPERNQHQTTPALRLVFLSRIVPIKNLDYAIGVLEDVDHPVALDIYGVVEDKDYWLACQRRISALPEHATVQYLGPVHPQNVYSVLSEYDALFLPTKGENFGHVIRESLAVGTPVLISDRTPWRNLESAGAGADLPLGAPIRFVSWLDRFARMSQEERHSMRGCAYALANDPEIADRDRTANLKIFANLASSGRIV